ncbi:MAG: host-nuclease inhibitor Gam family protein [Moraxella sp.]
MKNQTFKNQDVPKTCQNRSQAQAYIKAIGDNARRIARHTTKMNEELAKITAKYAERITPLQEMNAELETAVKIWCKTHKDELLTGDSKTANLITGEVSWRMGKASVVGKSTPELINRLERFGLYRFVRVKKELDKTAILKDPAAIADIEGVSVKMGVEELIITPFASS